MATRTLAGAEATGLNTTPLAPLLLGATLILVSVPVPALTAAGYADEFDGCRLREGIDVAVPYDVLGECHIEHEGTIEVTCDEEHENVCLVSATGSAQGVVPSDYNLYLYHYLYGKGGTAICAAYGAGAQSCSGATGGIGQPYYVAPGSCAQFELRTYMEARRSFGLPGGDNTLTVFEHTYATPFDLCRDAAGAISITPG